MILASLLNGILLPFVLIFALSLVNNKRIMGEYTNSKGYNYISWGTIGVLIVLTTTLVLMSVVS
jgi:Mn2+/Fe2+ NRAMP family transporter